MRGQLQLRVGGPPGRVSRGAPPKSLLLHPLDSPHPLRPSVLDARLGAARAGMTGIAAPGFHAEMRREKEREGHANSAPRRHHCHPQQAHLESWMERQDAPARAARPGEQFSVVSPRAPRETAARRRLAVSVSAPGSSYDSCHAKAGSLKGASSVAPRPGAKIERSTLDPTVRDPDNRRSLHRPAPRGSIA